jgi:hypothetical protein
MEHIAALLIVVGCSASLDDCRELPAPVPLFETAEECQVQRRFTLGDYAGRMPYVAATCVDVDPAMEEEAAELTWDVRPDGMLVASIDMPHQFAANAGRPEEDYFAE